MNPVGLAAGIAAIAAVAPGTAGAQDDEALLDRHRPLLRYDASEEYFAQPVSLPPVTAQRLPGDRVYGRVTEEDGRTWLQYWLFFADNPQDRGLVATGRHEGDWELVQVALDGGGQPVAATLSQHSWAETCGWSEVQTTEGDAAPVVYVANGSHAMYARRGDYDRPFPDPTDEAGGEGRTVRPAVSVIEDERPAWVAYPGRWGATEAGLVPGESSSPRGPRFAESGAWSEPAAYQASGRACGAGAPGRWWIWPAIAAPLLIVAGALIYRRRRPGALT
jgi:hypothetical protein